MTSPPFLTAGALAGLPTISHGFFGRAGGVSSGIYTSLNTGPGSNDNQDNVAENRHRCIQVLGVENAQLLTVYQIHSATVVTVNSPWKDTAPKADAMATKTPGLALGVLAADCMPWLMADPEAGVVGAAHAGWRGALAGVLENTVAAMKNLGATPANIHAALGPSLRQANFEVGLDLVEEFTGKDPSSIKFFAAGKNLEKRQFDLAGFGAERLRSAGVIHIDDVNVCTLDAPEQYFSYRGARQHKEPDYGRNLSLIALR